MDWIIEIVKAYTELGAAALFLGLFLAAMWALYKNLVRGRAVEISRCERMSAVVEQNTEALREQARVLEKLMESIEADRRETERLRVYLEAREQLRRR